jgi:hypothetical protein
VEIKRGGGRRRKQKRKKKRRRERNGKRVKRVGPHDLWQSRMFLFPGHDIRQQ